MLEGFKAKQAWQNTPPLWKGFLSGAFAAILLASLFSFGAEKDLKTVLVAQKQIPARTEIREEMLALRKIPARFLPQSAIQPENKNLILGKVSRFALAPGDALRWHDLLAEASGSETLSAKIPQGYRALSLALDKAESMREWLRAGDLIDIVGSFHQEKDNRQVTRTLFQNVTLLKTTPHLVFLLTPEQVELLTFAQRAGNLSLSLRNRADREIQSQLPDQAFQKFLGTEEHSSRKSSPEKSKGPQVLSLNRKGK